MQMQMGVKSCRWLLLSALVAFSALALSACGGGGSSKHNSVASATTGASGATGTAGATSGGAKPPKVSAGATGATSSRPRTRPPERKANPSPGTSASQQPSQPAGTTNGGAKKAPKKRTIIRATGPPSSYPSQQKELYREAKIICRALTLNGLAHEYGVKRTPDAVARAYARGYDATLRPAAYGGCKSAFVK